MSDYEFQCMNCGHQFDGVLHIKPDNCPECKVTEEMIVDAAEAERQERQNWLINKNDEFLEERN